ncbi:MAG TPA: DUF6391 domain-containing protein [Anaerolineae bacterium]|nr:DUF6391 domain-containing protein [Anaerolineae bacterium]
MLRHLIRATRQNHALEHATLHLLARRRPGIRLLGRTSPSGFAVIGKVDSGDLQQAAEEALSRLQRGEAHLAVHPSCGTNAVVTGVLVGGTAFLAGMGKSRAAWDRLPLVILLSTLAAIVAQPLAHLTQERVTTTSDLAGVSIGGMRRDDQAGLPVHRVQVQRS